MTEEKKGNVYVERMMRFDSYFALDFATLT
jgi:hypothetical protein